MTALTDALAALPDETRVSLTVGSGDLTVGELREALTDDGPKHLSTSQASERYGYAPDTWARWAKDGEVAGAWQDTPGGPWRLPLESCAEHIERLRMDSLDRDRRRTRGPWKPKAPPSARAGAEDLPAERLKVLEGGSPAVGSGADRNEEPRGPRLA